MIVYHTKNVRPAIDSRFMIFGERKSGTNYTEILIKRNFGKSYTWPMVWKHWMGFITEPDYSEDDVQNTLAVGVIRDPIDWLSSMRAGPPHAHQMRKAPWPKFLQAEWRSRHDDHRNGKAEFNYEIMEDRDFDTGERYENILKLRSKKLSWLLDPPIPCPYILVRYDDLKSNMQEVMGVICKTFSLTPHSRDWNGNPFFVDIKHDRHYNRPYQPHSHPRPTPEAMDIIRNGLDWDLEAKIGYKMI